MNLFPVDSSDPRIEGISHGVAEVIRKSGEAYSPADVISEVRSGNATCLMGDDEFAIVKIGKCRWTGRRYMLIWIAWSAAGDAVERRWQELQQFAKWADCEWLEWTSPRAGWARKHKAMGATVKHITFKKELE